MFSKTTVELSTTIPIPRAKAVRVITFNVSPIKYMEPKVINTATGTERNTREVCFHSFKKRKIIIQVKIAPDVKFWVTFDMASSIKVD